MFWMADHRNLRRSSACRHRRRDIQNNRLKTITYLYIYTSSVRQSRITIKCIILNSLLLYSVYAWYVLLYRKTVRIRCAIYRKLYRWSTFPVDDEVTIIPNRWATINTFSSSYIAVKPIEHEQCKKQCKNGE